MGLVEGIDLARACLFAHIIILEQPVAFGMQRRDVLRSGHKLALRGAKLLLVVLKGRLHVCLGGALLGEGGRICCALLRGLLHHGLVVDLRLLFACLRLGQLLLEVLDQEVDHGDHSGALLRLLRVGVPRLRRGRRRVLAQGLRRDLHKRGDTCACDAAWRRGRGRRATVVHKDALLRRKFLLRWCLVHLGIIELIEPVLRESQDLLSGRIRGHQLLVLSVFLLSLLCGLSHRLVQLLDARLKSCNLLSEGGDGVLCRRDRVLLLRHLALQGLLLVVSQIKLREAILLLVVIVQLLLLQHLNHLINHLDDLVEASLAQGFLSGERERQQLQTGPVLAKRTLPSSAQRGQRPRSHGRGRHRHLHQAGTGARQSLFEKIERIVVVEHLDRVSKRDQFLSAGLRPLLPLGGLRLAACLEIPEELLVRGQTRLGVRQVLLHLNDLNADLANLRRLGLHGARERRHLFGLGRHEPLVRLDGRLFRGRGICQILRHGVAHLLQDAKDLPRLRSIIAALRP
mmetsp:Transcript_90732/g.235308  ORF Transcript_90732/g.235308 Transcript_90732/m.235308 type:complete len:514 (+) Transcript_90732:135-1676(+)